MKRLLFVACLVFAIPAHSEEIPYSHSGNFWFTQCSPQATKLNSNCIYYLQGLVKGALGQAALSGSKQIFCLPSEATMQQVVDVFYKHLSDYPAHRHNDASVLAFLAFKGAFPCKP